MWIEPNAVPVNTAGMERPEVWRMESTLPDASLGHKASSQTRLITGDSQCGHNTWWAQLLEGGKYPEGTFFFPTLLSR